MCSMCIFIHVHVHNAVHTCTFTCMYTYIHTYTHLHAHTLVEALHTHTHTYSRCLLHIPAEEQHKPWLSTCIQHKQGTLLLRPFKILHSVVCGLLGVWGVYPEPSAFTGSILRPMGPFLGELGLL